jgi:hypothetical protein
MPLLEHLTYHLQVQWVEVEMTRREWNLHRSAALPNLRSIHFRFLAFVNPLQYQPLSIPSRFSPARSPLTPPHFSHMGHPPQHDLVPLH